MDHVGEALIGFVGAHRDTFEFLELAEEVLDEMPPLYISLSMARVFCAARRLGDNDLGTARVEIGDDGVAARRLVGDQRVEDQSLDEWRYATVSSCCRAESTKRTRCAERIGERQDLVVMPPFERPIAWLESPLRPDRGGGP